MGAVAAHALEEGLLGSCSESSASTRGEWSWVAGVSCCLSPAAPNIHECALEMEAWSQSAREIYPTATSN